MSNQRSTVTFLCQNKRWVKTDNAIKTMQSCSTTATTIPDQHTKHKNNRLCFVHLFLAQIKKHQKKRQKQIGWYNMDNGTQHWKSTEKKPGFIFSVLCTLSVFFRWPLWSSLTGIHRLRRPGSLLLSDLPDWRGSSHCDCTPGRFYTSRPPPCHGHTHTHTHAQWLRPSLDK